MKKVKVDPSYVLWRRCKLLVEITIKSTLYVSDISLFSSVVLKNLEKQKAKNKIQDSFLENGCEKSLCFHLFYYAVKSSFSFKHFC